MQLAESIHQGSVTATQVLAGMRNAGPTPEQALAQVNRLIDQQAQNRRQCWRLRQQCRCRRWGALMLCCLA